MFTPNSSTNLKGLPTVTVTTYSAYSGVFTDVLGLQWNHHDIVRVRPSPLCNCYGESAAISDCGAMNSGQLRRRLGGCGPCRGWIRRTMGVTVYARDQMMGARDEICSLFSAPTTLHLDSCTHSLSSSPRSRIPRTPRTRRKMPGDETRRKPHEDSDSEEESDTEAIVSVDIDPSKLTPLSPEVISKQVRSSTSTVHSILTSMCRRPSTWVCRYALQARAVVLNVPIFQVQSAM